MKLLCDSLKWALCKHCKLSNFYTFLILVSTGKSENKISDFGGKTRWEEVKNVFPNFHHKSRAPR